MGALRAKTAARCGACLVVAVAIAGTARAQAPQTQNLLVLRSGRVVDGRISQNAGGYLVEYDNGSMFVPRTQVLLLAESSQDAYKKLKDALPRNSVGSNLTLARWCMSNQLYTQARREIREALDLKPSSGAARRMMVRLDQLLNPDSADESKSKPTIAERIMAPPARSLSGLSRDAARRFVGKVQPILMNSCATSGCHGPQATNGFRLSRVRGAGGSRRGITERNLATVLRFVQPDNAVSSPILTQPTGNHGRGGRPVFRGRAGARQHELLSQWVRDVARETGSATIAKTDSQRQTKRRPASKTRRRSASGIGFKATPAMRAIRSRAEQRRVINDIRSDGRKDVFDPAEFNRTTAQRNRGPNSIQRKGPFR